MRISILVYLIKESTRTRRYRETFAGNQLLFLVSISCRDSRQVPYIFYAALNQFPNLRLFYANTKVFKVAVHYLPLGRVLPLSFGYRPFCRPKVESH